VLKLKGGEKNMVGVIEICVQEMVSGFVDITTGLTSGLVDTLLDTLLGVCAQSPFSMEGWATLLGK